MEAIDRFSDFPFSYHALAVCYKDQGLAKWRDYAVKGLAILDKTTKIKGHDIGQDQIRDNLKRLLLE